MKKLLVGLLILGCFSALAEDFNFPHFGDALIHADSDMNIVCEVLRNGKSVNSLSVQVEVMDFSSDKEVITLSRSTKVEGDIWGSSFYPNLPTKIITTISCN